MLQSCGEISERCRQGDSVRVAECPICLSARPSIHCPNLNDHRERNDRMNDDPNDGAREREREREREIGWGNRNVISGNRRPILRLI